MISNFENMNKEKGIFIAFEGIDGAGKSSLIAKINHAFSESQRGIYITAEPTKNYIGKHIREILIGEREGDEKTIAALFLADRIDHLTHPAYGIIKKLNEGQVVLCDRYYLSSYAYHVPHVTLEWVIEANSVCANLRRPDITFFIDISVDESLKRLTASRDNLDKYENRTRITQVRENYITAIEAVKRDENIIIIDGEKSPDEVFEQVHQFILDFFS
jgi:dTMP kinase